MNNKKSLGIILLAVFLSWGIVNTVSRIFFGTDSADMAILKYYDIAWIGYVLSSLLLVFNVASLYSILTKKRWGEKILYVFCVLNVSLTLFVLVMSLLNFEVAKDVYVQSRMSRGLSVENIDKIMNPATTIVMGFVYTIFYVLLGFYIRKKKDYFHS